MLDFIGSGDWIRTSDLWVMSPTSYQLLHPAPFFQSINIYNNGSVVKQGSMLYKVLLKKILFLTNYYFAYENSSSLFASRAFSILTIDKRISPTMKNAAKETIAFLDEPVKYFMKLNIAGPRIVENLLKIE